MCECLTKKVTPCKIKPKDGGKRCHVHLREPKPSRKFLSRFSTLMHGMCEDISNRLPTRHVLHCDESVCYYCKEKLNEHTRTKDHMVNLVENSWFNKLTNLTNVTVPCCRSCNQEKGKKKVVVPLEVTEEYVFEREDELRELVKQLKDIMCKIQELILTSPITVRKISSPPLPCTTLFYNVHSESDRVEVSSSYNLDGKLHCST